MALATRQSRMATETEGQWVPFNLVAGANTIVPGVAGQTIVCWHIIFTSSAVGVGINYSIKSGSNPFTGTMTATAANLEYFEDPLICGSGQDLVIQSSGAGGGQAYCVQG